MQALLPRKYEFVIEVEQTEIQVSSTSSIILINMYNKYNIICYILKKNLRDRYTEFNDNNMFDRRAHLFENQQIYRKVSSVN